VVTPATAQAIGLAVHELATNAGKHGALSDDKGAVEIAGGVSGIPKRFQLLWREFGGPPVCKPARKGFGSRVMIDMVKHNLSADARIDYAEAGVEWRLSCAANRVLVTPQD
jgi:two-component sensor histidine kinase